ncbi:MAG TPA: polymer-forming cytoskeletal protein [Anaerolineae bacterium]|nr:polymer-forming cytoskeletal protein [Anaerolineae bacterium]HMR64203.1 polymer-forming cytoskeletal protein [Anaerolineae bacterium]
MGASEIYIDGTIEGDLIAAGGYIEINGVVTGDAIVAGGGISLNGEVEDDVRAAGGGVDISGTIGDDFVAAAGGGSGFMMPVQSDTQTVEPGIHLADNAQVGGDALLAGGVGDLAGTINGELRAGMGQVSLAGQVGEDAHLSAGTVTVAETAQVGQTLFYNSEEQTTIPSGVAAKVEYSPPPQGTPADPASVLLGWLFRTLLILAGFALLGWLLFCSCLEPWF